MSLYKEKYIFGMVYNLHNIRNILIDFWLEPLRKFEVIAEYVANCVEWGIMIIIVVMYFPIAIPLGLIKAIVYSPLKFAFKISDEKFEDIKKLTPINK